MANSREGNVIFCDTDASSFPEAKYIEAIKYIGNASGTAVIQSSNSSGDNLWQEAGSSNVFNEVCIHAPDGLYVALTNSAKVYIYLK